ncbi:MAG: hypothetical protein GF364_15760 [Candidatus Lokiarchaeota archaeon]|nr:hypothetical protein [Candidatus Lokiarchaeota archaeon]
MIEIREDFFKDIRSIEKTIQSINTKFGFYINGVITIIIEASEYVKCFARKLGILTNNQGIVFLIDSNDKLKGVTDQLKALMAEVSSKLSNTS